MFKHVLKCAIVAGLCLVCCQISTWGQETAATVDGTVTDATGAALVGAAVVIHEDSTNLDIRALTTDNQGNYTATNLQPGVYTFTFKASGFKHFSKSGIILHVAEHRFVSAQLVPGAVSETVTVQADNAVVQTASSEQSTTITGEQIRELELGNRNFTQLVTLQPGVSFGSGDSSGFGMNNSTNYLVINGGRTTANNWTVDGVEVNDSGVNDTLLNVPSVDAIQEFTTERSAYDAQYGRSGAGQIVVATRSGSTAFHGVMYEFVRNDWLNANSFFGKRNDEARGIERYNNFGFTLGGPLYVPRTYNTDKNKTFFFWSEEWRKTTSPTTASLMAPTSDMLNGVVSGTVTDAPSGCTTYDSSTNTTKISSSCYSANSSAYLNTIFTKYPANDGSYYVATYSAMSNFRQDIVRIDHRFSDRLSFYARYMSDDVPEDMPQGLWAGSNYPGVIGTRVNSPGRNVIGNLTWIATPNLVNELEFGYTGGSISANASGLATSSSFISELTNNWAYKDPHNRPPAIWFYDGLVGFSPGSAPYFMKNLGKTVFDNLSWVHKNHTFRAGFNLETVVKTENASNGIANFNFENWADFLLGNVVSYSQSSRDIIPDLHYMDFEIYGQDSWKVSKNLFLNFGIRYSFFPSPTDPNNTLANFNPDVYSASAAPELDDSDGYFISGQTVTPATYANGIIFPKGAACAAAQAITSTVSCSPYGDRVNPVSMANWAPRFGFSYTPFGIQKFVIRGGYGVFFDRTMNGIFEQNAFTDPPLVQSTTMENVSFDDPMNTSGSTTDVSLWPVNLYTTGTPEYKTPNYQSWHLSVQRELDRVTRMEVAYVGGIGRHLLGEADLNQPTLSAREAQPTVYVNSIRPYLGYGGFHSNIAQYNSNYNSLQVSASRTVTNGLSIQIAYTWAKNLSDASFDRGYASTNTYNHRMDYGPMGYQQPQVFVASYVYHLPFFTNQNGLLGRVLGGWEVSGITTMRSGSPMSITQWYDPFNSDYTSGSNTFPGGLGLNQQGSMTIRADQTGTVHLKKKFDQWFDTSAFSEASGHFGSSKEGAVPGPGQQNWDLGFMKSVKLTEQKRLQIRGEFFNAFNHTNYSSIDTSVTDGSSFGQVTGTHNPRNIQIGAKLYF